MPGCAIGKRAFVFSSGSIGFGKATWATSSLSVAV